ncbi:uncharacterized protein LOC142482999 [Ascaphus truei]|uniref:uncharacterized protein LOC142482999 n=1 Tax=Ascaphus truei TaxID=8439 RepID=UPI003F5AC79A
MSSPFCPNLTICLLHKAMYQYSKRDNQDNQDNKDKMSGNIQDNKDKMSGNKLVCPVHGSADDTTPKSPGLSHDSDKEVYNLQKRKSSGLSHDSDKEVYNLQKQKSSGLSHDSDKEVSNLQKQKSYHEDKKKTLYCLIHGSGESYQKQPSKKPSDMSSNKPSDMPSNKPSDMPSDMPSKKPSNTQSNMPYSYCLIHGSGLGYQKQPSKKPSDMSSNKPSDMPSNKPSDMPSSKPSDMPSKKPSNTQSSMPYSYCLIHGSGLGYQKQPSIKTK